jgi:chemotaxis protein histidine kinase CheA
MSVSSDQAEEEVIVANEEEEEEEEEVLSASEDEDDDDDAPAVEAVEVAAEAVLSERDEDDDDDDDEETDGEMEVEQEAQEVQAAVVVDDDEDEEEAEQVEPEEEGEGDAEVVVEAEAVAVVAEEEEEEVTPKRAPRKSPKKSSSKKATAGSSSKGKDKKRKRKKPRRSAGEDIHFARISGPRLNAANAAREMLLETVPRLPALINDSYIVRSFGQLRIEASNKFSTANSLYPVGFCCDRYEFSPVHGRVLKLRCAILDGGRSNLPHNGPIFRVMWGQGVDEDVDKVEYPYDPYSNSAPILASENDDVVAIPAAPGGAANAMALPKNGMRVKVRFEKDQFYYGTIIAVKAKESDSKKKKKKRTVEIVVQYDDGSTEEAPFPDPDIMLVMPGKQQTG